MFGASAGSLYGNDMVLVMATTTSSETVTIPCQNVGTFDAVIDWGDGSTSDITAYNDADLAHVYAAIADHTIRISGTFPNIYFANGGDKLKLKEVIQLGKTGLTRLDAAFRGCTNLTSLGGGSVDTSAVTTMKWMCLSCSSLASVNSSGWDTSLVSSFESTFQTNSFVIPPDTSGWNTSSATTLASTFNRCGNMATAPDVSGWNTSSTTTLALMFVNCSAMATAPDVSGWITSLVANMTGVFNGCGVMPDAAIDGWDIEAVANFTEFMKNVTLPTARYDATLIAWDAQNPIDSLSVNFGLSKYTLGSPAATARANLVSNDGWVLSDGGTA